MIVKFSHPHYPKIGGRLHARLLAISCNAQVLTEDTSVKTTLDKCCKQQHVVHSWCDKQDLNQRFFVKMDKSYRKCVC